MNKALRKALIERAKELGYASSRSKIGVNTSLLAKKAKLKQPTVHRMLDGSDRNPKNDNFLKLWIALELPILTNVVKITKLTSH